MPPNVNEPEHVNVGLTAVSTVNVFHNFTSTTTTKNSTFAGLAMNGTTDSRNAILDVIAVGTNLVTSSPPPATAPNFAAFTVLADTETNVSEPS
jgi:hypothetical protein